MENIEKKETRKLINCLKNGLKLFTPHNIREFLHPSNVTWKPIKEAVKDTLLVLAVVVFMAVIMIAADTVLGLGISAAITAGVSAA